MFTFLFLVWFLFWLRGRLTERVDRVVRSRVVDSVPDVGGIVDDLWADTLVFGRLAWFAQVAYVRQQAKGAGSDVAFVPSFPGVSPDVIRDVVREELRVVDGKVSAPLGEVVERIGNKLETVVSDVARQVNTDCVGADSDRVAGSINYALEHGSPDTRFLADYQDKNSMLSRFLADNPDVAEKVRELVDGYLDEFPSTPVEADVEPVDSSPDVLEKRRVKGRETAKKWVEAVQGEDEEKAKQFADELAQLEAEWLREEHAGAHRVLVQAEIKLGIRDKNGNKFPLGWARIPTGAFTCGFCLMLCSRGPVYRKNTVTMPSNKAKAGLPVAVNARGKPIYHWGCDCIGVPVFDGESYDGHDQVLGAEQLYQHYVENVHKKGFVIEAKSFVAWLDTEEGRRAAQNVLSDMLASSAEERRRKRGNA